MSLSVCVCVSPPVPKGSVPLFPLQPLNEAGGRSVFRWLRPTKLVWTRDTRIGHPGVPALTELLLKLFHFLFASMVLHATPHKQVSHRSFQPLVNCSQPREWNIFSTIQVTGLFRLAVPPPSFSTWELSSLNTNVRVCFAQPSHSGAECDPVTGALNSCRKSCNWAFPPSPEFTTGSTLTEFTASTAAGPKNGFDQPPGLKTEFIPLQAGLPTLPPPTVFYSLPN